MTSSNVLDEILAGRIIDAAAAIDDAVDRWHDDRSDGRELHEALGFSAEEYSMWVEDAEALSFILYCRRFKLPLASRQDVEKISLAARADQPLDPDHLAIVRKWLRRRGIT